MINPDTPDLMESDRSHTDSSVPLTAGQMIRTARLNKGMHIAVLSVNLKVSTRQLEALESDRFDMSQGPAFVRALTSSVCRQLNMDPAPVLAMLPPTPGRMPVQRTSLPPLNSSNRLKPELSGIVRKIPFQTLVFSAVMVALIAALIWLPPPSTWGLLNPSPKSPMPDTPSVPMTSVVSDGPSETPQGAPAVSESVAAPVQAPADPQANASFPVQMAPIAKVAATSASVGAFVFHARQESWIEIRDGNNQVLWSRVLQAGQTSEVQYPLPMHVVVGRAREVDVTFKGKPFDLAPHTKVTVARFEVKE